MNRRRWLVGLAVVAAAIVVGFLAARQHAATRTAESRSGQAHGSVKGVALVATSAVSGTVHDPEGAPIEHASVCAQTNDRDAQCTRTDGRGAYTIDHLFPLVYTVNAAAPKRQPGRYHPDGVPYRDRFVLAAGERRTGVDIVLEAGAVELTGTVHDIGGGPVAGASVRVAREDFTINERRFWYPAVETSSDGSFTLWVAPGDRQIEASAEGYASIEQEAAAPGQVALLLTPAGSIAGTVVDRDNQPVAGALVAADWIDEHKRAHSDDTGHFLIEGLAPARYDVSARTANGYGTAVGSVLVGLAAHVDGIIIRVDPAPHIVGRVITVPPSTVCPLADVQVKLHDPFGDDVEMVAASDGTLHAGGVVATTYYAQVMCRGYYTPERYPPIVVSDRDLELVWPVTGGVALRGHVRTTEGAPVAEASVDVHNDSNYFWGRTTRDGSYEVSGIAPGDYDAWVSSRGDTMTTARLSIGPNATEKDFVLTRDGTIQGVVVDTQNRPVRDIEVRAEAKDASSPVVTTRSDGTFKISVKPSTYSVYAGLDWQHPFGGSERVTVTLAEPATVRFVVPEQTGSITGDVVDASGRVVADAFVYASTPSAFGFDMFQIGWNEHPTLTRPDGTFSITGLGPGAYTVVAQRRGGGMTHAKGIQPGSKVSLVIPKTASLSGRVSYTDHSHPQQMKLTVRSEPGADDRFFRDQTFYHTDGAFTLDELPGGTLTIAVTTADGLGVASVLLAPGEQRTDVAITVDRSFLVTGRLVDPLTRKGVPGFFIIPSTTRVLLGTIVDYMDVAHQTDADGHFSVLAPPGEVLVEINTSDPRDRTFCAPSHELDLRAAKDIGEIPVVRPRVKIGGAVGFTLAAGKVDRLDPKGPAAAAGLHVGDVVTAVDGAGPASLVADCGFAMIAVAPSSVLALTLARGDTVRITAGPEPAGSEIEIDSPP